MNRYLELLYPEPMARSYSYDSYDVSYDTSDDLYHELMMEIAEGHNDDWFSADMDGTVDGTDVDGTDVDGTVWDDDETWWDDGETGWYDWFDPAFYVYDTLFVDDTVGSAAGA